MSKPVTVNFKLDGEVKANMEQVCSELGLSMSAAFTIFAKTVSRERRIPFALQLSNEPNAATRRAIQQAEKESDMHGPFESVSDLMEALNA